MPDLLHLSLAACMFLGAALYSSVGHAGASAYIAFMALFSVPPSVMRPTALTLNILVATFASYRYARAGYFRWRVVWPFLLGSVPFAFIGGGIQLPSEYYRAIVGIVLILSGLRMFWAAHIYAAREVHDPPIWLSILLGIGIGFLSGLTGTGGGIFLSPVIIFLRRRAGDFSARWSLKRLPGSPATELTGLGKVRGGRPALQSWLVRNAPANWSMRPTSVGAMRVHCNSWCAVAAIAAVMWHRASRLPHR